MTYGANVADVLTEDEVDVELVEFNAMVDALTDEVLDPAVANDRHYAKSVWLMDFEDANDDKGMRLTCVGRETSHKTCNS